MIDHYLNRRYDASHNNCGHFVVEVWKELTGQDISLICQAFLQADMIAFREHRKQYEKLKSPIEPCIVAMQNPKFNVTHVGVYTNNGILHLSEGGAKHETLETLDPMGQLKISYYR